MNNLNVNMKNRTIEMTKKFAAASSKFGTEEYKTLQEVRRDYPSYKVVTITRKASKSDSSAFKGLTYEYMEKYSVMIVNSQFKREKEIEALNNFCKYSVDGIFLACTVHQDVLDQFKPILRDKNIPLVLLEARLHSDDYNYIMIDDEAGMVQAIEYLLQKGYGRIGFMSEYVTDVMRNAMFISAIRRNGLDPADNPIYTHPTKRFEEAGYELMQQILRDPSRPRAFLAGYDDMAIGAIRAAEEAGFSVPRDFAIIGNDNIREAPFLHTSLSTLSPPIERMVELGVRMMLDCIREHDLDSIHRVTLKPELILREST